MKPMHMRLPATQPASYYSMASGGLGFGLPASVGIALAERETGRNRPVIAVIGDGSFQYSIQALYTAAQHKLPVLVVVPDNREYAILKSFAEEEKTTGRPGPGSARPGPGHAGEGLRLRCPPGESAGRPDGTPCSRGWRRPFRPCWKWRSRRKSRRCWDEDREKSRAGRSHRALSCWDCKKPRRGPELKVG